MMLLSAHSAQYYPDQAACCYFRHPPIPRAIPVFWASALLLLSNHSATLSVMNADQVGRRKARLACEPCRQRKRKCDGRKPCYTCTRYEHACFYKSEGRRSKARPPADSTAESTVTVAGEQSHIQPTVSSPSYEAEEESRIPITLREQQQLSKRVWFQRHNGGSRHHQPVRADSWNLGLRVGPPFEKTLLDFISNDEAQKYADTYFQKVHAIFRIVDQNQFTWRMTQRWTTLTTEYDAILGGVVALGSLFSGSNAHPREMEIVDNARCELEFRSPTHRRASADITVQGWILRVLYVRMAVNPHAAWMASRSCIDAIEGDSKPAGMAEPFTACGQEPTTNSNPHRKHVHFDHARLHWIARMLHTWICRDYDLTKSNRQSHSISCLPPVAEDSQDFTPTLISMFRVSSRSIYSDTPKNLTELTSVLHEMNDPDFETHPVLKLHKSNRVFCVYTIMRSLKQVIPGSTLTRVIEAARPGLEAALQLAQDEQPWWYVVHLPFRFLCVMLSMDTRDSLVEVEGAMIVLRQIEKCFSTKRMQAIINTADALVEMCRVNKAEAMEALERSKEDTFPPDLVVPGKSSLNVSSAVSETSHLMPSAQRFADTHDGEASYINMDTFDWDDFLNLEFPIDLA